MAHRPVCVYVLLYSVNTRAACSDRNLTSGGAMGGSSERRCQHHLQMWSHLLVGGHRQLGKQHHSYFHRRDE